MLRTRWAAIGAALAVSLGAGGIGIGYAVSTGGAVFVPVSPCRLFDTRSGSDNVGPRSTPLGPGDIHTQQVTGNNGQCTGIPGDASAIALNVTTVNATAGSFLTIFPADLASSPLASNLNWRAGDPPNPNKVDVKLSPTGAIKLYNLAGTVDVLADVVGYYQSHTHDDRYYTKAEADTKAPAASFAASTANSALGASYVEVARLSNVGAGAGGAIAISSPARLLLTGAVTINENGATGQDSQSRCKFQRALDGGGWFDVGQQQFAEAEGNSNHDETVSIALATGLEVTAGTHDVRIVCAASLFSGSPAIESGELTVLAVH